MKWVRAERFEFELNGRLIIVDIIQWVRTTITYLALISVTNTGGQSLICSSKLDDWREV